MFWPCTLSFRDGARFDLSVVQGPKQQTDIYWLGLAVEHGGSLATFDRRVRASYVTGGGAEHLALRERGERFTRLRPIAERTA